MNINFNEAVMTIEQLEEWVEELRNNGIQQVKVNGIIELTKEEF